MRSSGWIVLASFAASAASAPLPRAAVADERALEQEARLDAMIEVALAHNPGLLEAQARVDAQVARIAPAARLPDLELKAEAWGVPLERPASLDEAETLMLGVRQAFPAPGSRGARKRVASREADLAREELAVRRLDVVREVTDAHVTRALADRERRLHVEHLSLAAQALELGRAAFRAGRASEQDVLRIAVTVSRLHRDLAAIEQREHSSTARLHALMGLPEAALLGPAPPLAPTEIASDLAALATLARTRRPELRAAELRAARDRAEVDAASAEATWPSVMVGVDYWNLPRADEPHAYGAMVAIGLPWLNPKRREEVTAASRAVRAAAIAQEDARRTVAYEVADTHARYVAARAVYQLTRDEVVPAAERSFEAAQAGLAGGQGSGLALVEALDAVLEAHLDEAHMLAELRLAIAALDRAVGVALPERPLAAADGGHP